MIRSIVFAMAFASAGGATEPRLYVENAVLSEEVSSFDLKVFAATSTEHSPIFIIGVGWDPAALDIVSVNFEGTIFQSSAPPFWSPDRMLTIKPGGQPVLGIYTMLSCDPCLPLIPAGEQVPLVNLRFLKIGGTTGSTAVRLIRAPGPPTNPSAEFDTQLYVEGALQPVETGDGGAVFVPVVPFLRGDSNADGTVDISDGIRTLSVLFLGAEDFPCAEAADANTDGTIDLSDAIATFTYLFNGGPSISAPFPTCGTAAQLLGCLRLSSACE